MVAPGVRLGVALETFAVIFCSAGVRTSRSTGVASLCRLSVAICTLLECASLYFISRPETVIHQLLSRGPVRENEYVNWTSGGWLAMSEERMMWGRTVYDKRNTSLVTFRSDTLGNHAAEKDVYRFVTDRRGKCAVNDDVAPVWSTVGQLELSYAYVPPTGNGLPDLGGTAVGTACPLELYHAIPWGPTTSPTQSP